VKLDDHIGGRLVGLVDVAAAARGEHSRAERDPSQSPEHAGDASD
jgi:hypothetical protein